MQDLSHLAADSMWPTSQEAGNMVSGRAAAMSAPGSPPVTPLPPAKDQGEPHVSPSGPKIPPGTSQDRLHGPDTMPDWSSPDRATEQPFADAEPVAGNAPPGRWRQL